MRAQKPIWRAVVIVAGPTGSGKTTLLRRLAGDVTVYYENASLNPHFSIRSSEAFDARASQTWFLDNIAAFLRENVGGAIGLDQHPLVVSRVYGRMFHSKGLLSTRHLAELDRYAVSLSRQVSEEASKVLTTCLTASTQSLLRRVRARATHGMSAREISELNRRCCGLVLPGPCVVLNTDVVSIGEETATIRAWLSRRAIV